MSGAKETSALLVVDVQNDFCPGGSLAAPDGDKIIPGINKIADKFEVVIASKDWHPEESKHFEKWPKHCLKNTEGAEFPGELQDDKFDQVFLKGSHGDDDGYSAFEATNVNLNEYLKEKNILDLYICGLTTEFCVKFSSLDAVREGYNTFVLTDLIKPVKKNPDDPEKARLEMQKKGVYLIESDEIPF